MNNTQKRIRNEAKCHIIYRSWIFSDKTDPSPYLKLIDITNNVGKLVYYWICEDDMTKLNDEQLSNMNAFRNNAFYCS